MSWSSWLLPLAGGLCIGASALGFLRVTGRIAGMSGFSAELVDVHRAGRRGDAVAFLLGLVVTGALLSWAWPERFGRAVPFVSLLSTRDGLTTALAGLLVGFGARLAGGCTSGHGVCGIGRLSPRSLVATVLFVLTGAATVYVTLHGRGAP